VSCKCCELICALAGAASFWSRSLSAAGAALRCCSRSLREKMLLQATGATACVTHLCTAKVKLGSARRTNVLNLATCGHSDQSLLRCHTATQ
jgi:hypothetical protein